MGCGRCSRVWVRRWSRAACTARAPSSRTARRRRSCSKPWTARWRRRWHSPLPLSTEETRTSHERHAATPPGDRSEEHTSELQSLRHLVCRLLLEKKKKKKQKKKQKHQNKQKKKNDNNSVRQT